MRKRERENPCFICNHYHKDEEVCQVCGHRQTVPAEKCLQQSAFSVEILPFLYLGSYDNASRAELLKAQGITHILNTVAGCQNLYKNSFTYYTLTDDNLPLGECLDFIEKCRLENTKVLVHCMSGQSRSPAVVMAYLMRHRGWRLVQCYEFVKERRPLVNLSADAAALLQKFEAELFGCNRSAAAAAAAAAAAVEFGPPDVTAGLSFAGNNLNHASNFVFAAVRQQAVPDQSMDGS